MSDETTSQDNTNDSAITAPDWTSPKSVLMWSGDAALELWQTMNRGQRPTATQRMNALVKLIDAWSRAYKLVNDSQAADDLRQRLETLEAALEDARRSGIQRVK